VASASDRSNVGVLQLSHQYHTLVFVVLDSAVASGRVCIFHFAVRYTSAGLVQSWSAPAPAPDASEFSVETWRVAEISLGVFCVRLSQSCSS
jgi:hypothetical protein